MNAVESARAHMVVADRRTSKRCAARCRTGELTRVIGHVFVETSYLINAANRWEATRRATAVRICAVALTHGPAAVISHESAAVGHQLEMVSDLVDIHVCASRAPGNGVRTLPALPIVGGEEASAVRLIVHEVRLDAGWTCEPVRGVRMTDLVTTAVQCAATMPAQDGLVVACGALRRLSGFDRFTQETSRVQEERARRALLARAARMPARRGARRARAVLNAADAGCESVPERLMVGILKAGGFHDVRTQVYHRVGWRDYYVDFELPGCHVIIEFDGESKHGTTVGEVHRSYGEQMKRQKDLESVGLVVVRFTRADLRSPDLILDEVARRAGLRVRPRHNRLLAT